MQGTVDPDEFYVRKTTFRQGHRVVLSRSLGRKQMRMVYARGRGHTRNVAVPKSARERFCINDAEVLKLADDAIQRGLQRPEFLIVDGAPGLEIAAVWDGVPVQRCTVRNLLAHAPESLHEEITADYNDMIYAATREEVEARRRTFIRKWRLKHRAVADSLQEAGDRLFTFTRLPPSQWRSVRTTNAIERLHEEFKRRIKTQTVLPSADTAAMLFWALLASGQINMRKGRWLANARHQAKR